MHGCSPATVMYLYRATAEVAADEDLWRADLAMHLTAAMTGSGRANYSPCVGVMSTGQRGRSGSAAG